MGQLVTDRPSERAVRPALDRWLRFSRRPETVVAVLALAVLTVLIASIKVMDVSAFQGDTALFFQLTRNIADRGEPMSTAYTNILAFTTSRLVTETAAQIAKNPLVPPPNTEGNVLFTLHSYYIMYPIGLLAKIFPVSPLLMSLFALSFVGVLGLAYFGLRRVGVPITASLLFCALVVSHPAWSTSLMTGQFYPDRLFVLLGFAFMYLLSRDDVSRGALVASAVLAALVIERAPMTMGMFAIAYVILYWQRPTLDRYFKLGLGAALLFYGIFLLKFELANPVYTVFLPTSFSSFAALFSDPVLVQKTGLFFLINGLLLIVALFEWRAAAIAAFLMLPNILGTIGGGEKIGWSTHYHSYYFPALIWAAMLGYAVAYRRFDVARRRGLFYAGAVAVAVALSAIDPYAFAPPNISLANVAKNVIFTLPGTASTYLGTLGRQDYAAAVAVNEAVPRGATVTTPEGAMSFLYDKRAMYFYPFGIDTADYAALPYTAVPGGGTPTYSGALSFLPAAEKKKINDVLVARMRRHGYDLEHPVLFPRFSLAIVKRYRSGVPPAVLKQPRATVPTAPAAPAASPSVPEPVAAAIMVQHASTVAARGAASPTDLTGKFPKRPATGHVLLAFASTGFGCTVAPGWVPLGTGASTIAAVAYRIVQPGDSSTFVPFTTATANGYALELIDVDGGPDMRSTPQVGGMAVLAKRVENLTALAIPQRGGLLFAFSAGLSKGRVASASATLPKEQRQVPVDRIQQGGNAAALFTRVSATDPFVASQPFASAQALDFTVAEPPGNISLGWLVWVGGRRR